MTKKRFSLFLVCLWLVVVVLPVLAQDALTQTFTASDSSFAFQYPDGWKLAKEVNGSIALKSGDTAITFYGPPALAGVGVAPNSNDLADTLNRFLIAKNIDVGVPQLTQVSTRSAARAEKISNTTKRLAFGVAFSNRQVGVMLATGPANKLDTLQPTLEAMIRTFDTPGGGVQTAEPCTVSTDKARLAAVRVGPGTNRTAIAFLTPNKDYAVLDQATVKDGSQWWKLVKEEAAPGKATNEAWVAQEQVVAKGGCDNLSGAVPATPQAALLPTAGMWTLSIGPELVVDCGGLKQTTTLPSNNSNTKLLVTAESDGSIIYLGTDKMTRSAPGAYSGAFDLTTSGQNMTAEVALKMVSPDLMEGEIVIHLQDCTGNAAMKLQREP